MKKRMFFLPTLLVGLLSSSYTQAACLGLQAPVPKTTNVCEKLLQRLVIPRTEAFCDIPWYARIGMPHCNLPGACHVDPTCKTFEAMREVGETVLNTGDFYCDTREITPEKMIENIANQTYSDLFKLTTGGTSSILFDVANRHIDIMSCSGIPLTENLKTFVNIMASRNSTSRNNTFHEIDVNRVRIISDTHPTAKLYLRGDKGAITLDDLVIVRDGDYQILKDWGKIVGEELTTQQKEALVLMVHELVHVRQYRDMGRETFVNRYISEAIVKGYANIAMEQEAYQVDKWAEAELSTPEKYVDYSQIGCKQLVQDKIAWDEAGNNHWHDNNLNTLCRGTTVPYAPGACFRYFMNSGNGWGRRPTDTVNWEVGLSLCAGTSANRVVQRCLRDNVARGQTLAQVVEQCRTR